MNLTAYTVEYTTDGGESWETGALHWTIESAADEGRTRGKCSYWRLRQIILHDGGMVPFEETCEALDNLRETESQNT